MGSGGQVRGGRLREAPVILRQLTGRHNLVNGVCSPRKIGRGYHCGRNGAGGDGYGKVLRDLIGKVGSSVDRLDP
jgi:hypothetical protein